MEQGLLFTRRSLSLSFVLDHFVPKPAPRTRRKLSREGLLLIKSFEGFRPCAVSRRDGTLTIGYGHTQSARAGISISEEEAELLLMHDLIPATHLIHTQIKRPLNQNQFDALVSFIYSIGPERFVKTGILDLIRKGRMAEVATVLASIPDRQQPPVDTPYRRRCAERALFERADKPTLVQLLLAPISRPDKSTTVPDDAVLGVTGVMRHENLQPLHTRRTPETRGDLGTVVLLAAVGVVVSLAAFMAFQHGASVPILESHGLLIAGSLCLLGMVLIGGAVWLFSRAPKAL